MSNHPTIQPQKEAFSAIEQTNNLESRQHSMLSAIAVAAFVIQDGILPSLADEEGGL